MNNKLLRSFCPYCYSILITALNVLSNDQTPIHVTWLPGGDNSVYSGLWGQILDQISTLAYSKLRDWGVPTPHFQHC